MLKINVKANVAGTMRQLEQYKKQITFATALALTKTAQHVKSVEVKEMRRVFDRPTDYTLNSLYVKPATKAKLQAYVWLKDDVFKGTPAAKYLLPQIRGGARSAKRFERALINTGIMPAGMYAVPAAGAPIDVYGNIPSKFIVQLLSYLRAFGEQGYKANMNKTGRDRYSKAQARKTGSGGIEYFVINRNSHLPMGVYLRVRYSTRTAIKPVLLFVKTPGYGRRFDFFGIAEKEVAKVFPAYFSDSVRYALSTAK